MLIEHKQVTTGNVNLYTKTGEDSPEETPDYVEVHFSGLAAAEFRTLVQRGLNLWPDASPEMKEFGDLLLEGKILQDYWAQDTSPRSRKQTNGD